MKYRNLDSSNDPLFWSALEFYVESFPREEREPLERVAAVASGAPEFCSGSTRRIHFAIAEVDGQLAGMRYFSYNAKARLGFFIYLAVEPRFRRQGIGEKLIEFGRLQCIEDAQAMDSGLDAIVFECERPELAQSDEDRVFRENRLEYFAKRGAKIISKDYYQPALGPDRETVPLYLLAYPLADDVDWSAVIIHFHRDVLGYAVDSEEERKCIRAIQ